MQVVLSNGRLSDGRAVDIHISSGIIDAVTAAGGVAPETASNSIDLDGWLVLPAMAEPHAHLDKALTAEFIPNPTGDLMGAIESWIANAGDITEAETEARASQAVEMLVASGVTAVRTHVNCGEIMGPSSVKVLSRVRDTYRNVIDMQIVALPSNPMTGTAGAGNRAALAAGIEAGADLVGGCPHLDPDGTGLIDVAIDAAVEAGINIDLHVDETLDVDMLTLRDLARRVIDRCFDGSVTASHCVSLGMQEPSTQAEVAGIVAEAGIAVIALPQTNLFLQGHEHPTAMPRGITAIRALRDAGVVVAAGADNVQDPFNLVGRSDPLETAALLVMAGHVLPDDAYHLVAGGSRKTLGLAPVTISAGDPADLIAIDASSTRAAIAEAPMSRKVFRGGHLVAESTTTTTLFR